MSSPQFNEAPTSDPIFSKKRMQDTLTSGYFEMLGTMSNRKEGLESVMGILRVDVCILTLFVGFWRNLSSLQHSIILLSSKVEMTSSEESLRISIITCESAVPKQGMKTHFSSSGGHARIVLSKALTSIYKVTSNDFLSSSSTLIFISRSMSDYIPRSISVHCSVQIR